MTQEDLARLKTKIAKAKKKGDQKKVEKYRKKRKELKQAMKDPDYKKSDEWIRRRARIERLKEKREQGSLPTLKKRKKETKKTNKRDKKQDKKEKKLKKAKKEADMAMKEAIQAEKDVAKAAMMTPEEARKMRIQKLKAKRKAKTLPSYKRSRSSTPKKDAEMAAKAKAKAEAKAEKKAEKEAEKAKIKARKERFAREKKEFKAKEAAKLKKKKEREARFKKEKKAMEMKEKARKAKAKKEYEAEIKAREKAKKKAEMKAKKQKEKEEKDAKKQKEKEEKDAKAAKIKARKERFAREKKEFKAKEAAKLKKKKEREARFKKEKKAMELKEKERKAGAKKDYDEEMKKRRERKARFAKDQKEFKKKEAYKKKVAKYEISNAKARKKRDEQLKKFQEDFKRRKEQEALDKLTPAERRKLRMEKIKQRRKSGKMEPAAVGGWEMKKMSQERMNKIALRKLRKFEKETAKRNERLKKAKLKAIEDARKKEEREILRAQKAEEARLAKEEADRIKKIEDRKNFLFGAMSEIRFMQGDPRVIDAVQKAESADGVKFSQPRCAKPGETPKPFVYQEFVSHAVKPNSPIQRLLCVHRTGAGKTFTMVRILENFWEDSRSKVIVFPNENLVKNFYSELLFFPNVYRDYLENVLTNEELTTLRNGDQVDCPPDLSESECRKREDRARAAFSKVVEKVEDELGLKGKANLRGQDGQLSAPIRALSYGKMGGSEVFRPDGGKPKNLLFNQNWDSNAEKNPFNNCIILCDEVHNMIQPVGCGAFCNNYVNLQRGIATMKNSVFVGFTATPLPSGPSSGDLLMAIVRGLNKPEGPAAPPARRRSGRSRFTPKKKTAAKKEPSLDEVYKTTLEPLAQRFLNPNRATDQKRLNQIKKEVKDDKLAVEMYKEEMKAKGKPSFYNNKENQEVVEKIMANLAKQRGKWAGYTSYYYAQPLTQYPKYIPTKCITIDGFPEQLDKKYTEILTNSAWPQRGQLVQMSENREVPPEIVFKMQNFCNIARAPTPNVEIAREYVDKVDLEEAAPKFLKVANAVVKSNAKSLVIIDRGHSMVALVEIINKMGNILSCKSSKCCAKSGCFAKLLNTTDKFDADGNVIETPENEKILREFNSKANGFGEKIKCLVIDAKTYSEGVSFFGVTELHIVNPSMRYSTHLQQLGRAFRACKFVNKVVYKKKPERPVIVNPDYTKKRKPSKKQVAKLAAKNLKATVKYQKEMRKWEKFQKKNPGQMQAAKVLKQEIKVFIYRTLSDEYMSADEYALYMQDIGKQEFIKDMQPFELAAIDRGIYTAFDGKYKTGTEPTCYEGGDSDSENEDRPDLKARQAKKKEEERKKAIAARDARRDALNARRGK